MENTIMMAIKKDGQILMEAELSRFSTTDGNLALGLKSADLVSIPMLYQGVYEITITTPTQVITKTAIYISYNYVVFSNTVTNDDGSKTTYLECSDNGLLFRIIG